MKSGNGNGNRRTRKQAAVVSSAASKRAGGRACAGGRHRAFLLGQTRTKGAPPRPLLAAAGPEGAPLQGCSREPGLVAGGCSRVSLREPTHPNQPTSPANQHSHGHGHMRRSNPCLLRRAFTHKHSRCVEAGAGWGVGGGEVAPWADLSSGLSSDPELSSRSTRKER